MSSRSDVGSDSPAGNAQRRAFGDRSGTTPDAEEIAVTEPSRDDVLQTVFGLGGHDVRTYDAVGDAPGSTTRELADRLDRDRSNVNRSLNRLREVGLVTRGRRLLDAGGHVYQYYAAPEEMSENIISRAVDRWRSAALGAVDAVDTDDAVGTERPSNR